MARERNQAQDSYGEISPGSLYSEIKIDSEEFGEGERKLTVKPLHPFESYCKRIYKMSPGLGRGEKFSEENKRAIEFLDWNISAEEMGAAYKFTLIASFFGAIVVALLLYLSPVKAILDLVAGQAGFLSLIYMFLPPFSIAAYIIYYVQSYPVRVAKTEQIKALTYVPEILGYMVMSMKLSPNLEKAIEFGAEHGKGKIAEDFQDIIWDTQVGVYNSISEALDALAYRWGEFSDEFKKSLMRIRASVIEPSESKRFALLDKTIDEILDSIKLKMEQYARDLNQPSIILFYLGVLLPLILIIVLPVGSSFSGAPLANPIVLGLLYLVVIPLITYIFARTQIIAKRPPTYDTPKIDDNFPELPPKNKMFIGQAFIDVRLVVALLLVVGFIASFYFSTQGLPPKALYGAFNVPDGTPQIIPADKQKEDVIIKGGLANKDYFDVPAGTLYRQLVSRGISEEKAVETVLVEEKKFFTKPQNDITPYNLIFGGLITLSLACFVYLYYTNIYKRQKQVELMKMEIEFKDSLYIIASRMGENKPLEEAFKSTQEFLPQYQISQKIFPKIIDNISILAMPLDKAVFDENYGALKNIPSNIIRGSMRLLIDSVQLGVNVAARTMIALSIQLSNQEKVSNSLKILVGDITSMMKVMSLFIAPMVLGITTALQKIVIITLSSIASSGVTQQFDISNVDLSQVPGVPSTFSGLNVGSFIDPQAIASMATPTQFIFIIAIFVIEIVVIMTYFTTKIEEDNDLLFKINLAKYLPIAVASFVISIIVANLLIGGFLSAQ